MVTGLLIVAKHSIELEADQFLSDQIQLYGLPENQTVTFENSTVQTTNGINATELVDLVQQQVCLNPLLFKITFYSFILNCY